jgi:inner membrane protein
MDNLTHSLTGLALSRAGFDRFCPRALWLLLLSANAPDIDIVAAPLGAFRYLEVHRGYTHSLVGLPFMALLTVVVVAALFREKLSWMRAWLIAIIGLISHLLLDWTNNYGVRFLLPFSSRWFHLDWNSLCDPWILVALMLAALWPVFARMVNREIGDQRPARGRAIAISMLLFFLLFDTAKGILHARILAQLQSRLYNGNAPLQVAALPETFNPLEWTAIVETPDEFQKTKVSALNQASFDDALLFYKPPVTKLLETVRSDDPFRYFLYFSRFPVWSFQPVTGEHTRGTRADLTDLRFGVPSGGSFHCVAYLDEAGKLIERRFTYGTGSGIGWNGSRVASSGQ